MELTPLPLPACERLARISTRRRAGSTVGSSTSSESAATIYQQGIEEMTKAKDKEIEKIKARLKEAMNDVEASEQSRRDLEEEVEELNGKLRKKTNDLETLQDLTDTLDGDAERAKHAKKKFQNDSITCRKEVARWKLCSFECEARSEFAEDESQERQALVLQVATAASSHSAQLSLEASALRKQVKEMQLRMDNLVELGRESLRVQNRAEPVICSSHEALKDDLANMRREKNEALGALRAERNSHAALLERYYAVEAARDTALRQLAELPDLERQIEMLSRNKLGESGWQMEKQNLEGLLRKKALELAQMTKRRDKAKKKEQETVAELVRLKGLMLSDQQNYQVHSQQAQSQNQLLLPPPLSSSSGPSSVQQPASRTETPASTWTYPNPTPSEATRDAEVAFLRSRVRELTHQGRYAAGFSTPPPGAACAP